MAWMSVNQWKKKYLKKPRKHREASVTSAEAGKSVPAGMNQREVPVDRRK